MLSQFPLTSNSKRDVPFCLTAYNYSRADWNCLHDHLRDVPWQDVFKLSASAAATDFLIGFRLELMYISLIVNIRSCLFYIHGFHLIVLLSYLIEATSFICTNRVNFLHQKWSSGRLVIIVFRKCKSAIPHLFNCLEMFCSTSDKVKFFTENVSKNSTFDDTVISLTAFPSRTNLKLNISVTHNFVKKIITNLDFQRRLVTIIVHNGETLHNLDFQFNFCPKIFFIKVFLVLSLRKSNLLNEIFLLRLLNKQTLGHPQKKKKKKKKSNSYAVFYIIKHQSVFIFFMFYVLFYTQLVFVFHLQRNFYIAHAHILAFCLSLLQKDFYFFHELFFVVFLCYLGNI